MCVKLPLEKLPLAKLRPTFFWFFQPSSQLQCVGACEDVCLKLQLVDACEALTNKAPAKVFLGFCHFLLFCQLAFSVTIFYVKCFQPSTSQSSPTSQCFLCFFNQHVQPAISQQLPIMLSHYSARQVQLTNIFWFLGLHFSCLGI